MPVYEFYCPDCHMIFNFMSRRMNTRKRPDCPKCARPRLERRISLFAVSRGLKEPGEDPELPDLDEGRMEKALEAVMREADHIDEDDPREMGRIMRKLYDATGLDLGPRMQEAIQRMEAGEDPDKIDEEMGDLLEAENPFASEGGRLGIRDLRRRVLPPSVDETLYEL